MMSMTIMNQVPEIGNEHHRYVCMMDPGPVVDALAKKGRVDANWRATYDARRIATKEAPPGSAAKSDSEKVVRRLRKSDSLSACCAWGAVMC